MPDPEAIEVTVRLLPPLKNTAGTERVKLLVAPGATIRQVIDALASQFDTPEFLRHLYDERGRIIPGWCAFVNERPFPLNTEKGLSERVARGDEITLMLNVAGG